ncbi:S2/P23 family protein (plasmid) [Borrelia recurrentis]|uniref:P23-like cell envelope protein n=1 Tax=Borrelia recurrentis (strain A1) TaxID=412418 RepID=B5RRZ6_BORRA|nr:S2/P23 family protein [Borrelia recurrentis]ACH95132.1 p23-like cell envelope protein [Borrelia recurrentis A1]
MNTKILLSIPTVVICTQCNNTTNEKLQYEENLSREIISRRKEYIEKFEDLQSRTTNPTEELNKTLKEPYETIEGNKSITIPILFMHKTINITWIKNKALTINGLDSKPISELQNKIRYSYSISPIKEDGALSNKIMPIVLFETTQNGQDFEVTSFTLIDAPNLDFNTRKYSAVSSLFYTPPKTEKSQESGYVNAYPFWIANKNNEVIKALTQSRLIRAKIKVKNPKTRFAEEYNIELDTQYLILLITDVLQKNPGLSKVAPNFNLK